MKPLLFSFFLLSALPATSQVQQHLMRAKGAEPTADIWPMLKDSAYSLAYPPGWELNQSGALGTAFFLFAPRESPQDSFRENINLLIEDLSKAPMDLDAYVAFSVEKGRQFMNELVILDSTRLKDAHGPFHQLVFTGRQGVFRLKWKQHYRVAHQKAYVLTFTAQESRYPAYLEWIDNVLDSFALRE